MNIESLEEFKTWFDSHKRPDGSICLADNPDLIEYFARYLNANAEKKNIDFKALKPGCGECINFELGPRYMSTSND